jgi:ABC-type nitrate/sulfonate/bicarbonate transport system permease component
VTTSLLDRRYQVFGLVAILVVWQLSAWLINMGDTYPGPITVVPELLQLTSSGAAWGPLLSTLGRTAAGFVVGFVLAVAYGVCAYAYPRMRDYTDSLFNILMFSPSLIIIFVGLIVLGQTFTAVVVIVALCIFTDIAVYMRDAFTNFDTDLAGMATSYHATLRQRATDVYLPFLAPAALTTTRLGFTLAWKTAFLCEIFGFPNGLGWELRGAYRIYDIPLMMAWLSIFVITLLVFEQLVRAIEAKAVRW